MRRPFLASAFVLGLGLLSLLTAPTGAQQYFPPLTGPTGYQANYTLVSNQTQTCTPASTAETDLWNWPLPAVLLSDGQGIRIVVSLTMAANANIKTGRLYFGATVLATRGGADNGVTQVYAATVWRRGATSQVTWSDIRNGSGNGVPLTTTPAETLSGPVTIRLTGQNGTATAGEMCRETAAVEALR